VVYLRDGTVIQQAAPGAHPTPSLSTLLDTSPA
jgi:hypothetical protein